MTRTKIAVLIRCDANASETPAKTLGMLATAHASLFGFAATLASEEELVAAGEGQAGRVLKLEIDAEREPDDPSTRLKLAEQSLNQVAKRAGVAVTFELFTTRAEPVAGGAAR